MRKRNIVLASASPRRSELMHMLGFSNVIIHPADGAEHPPKGATPEETVKALSRQAFSMLKRLSGRAHEVYTGVTVLDGEGELCEAERSVVHFRQLADEEIRRYIATGEPMDKAGAYGAQGKGALFVRAIEGDFFNVMGLPLCRLGQMLAEKGVPIL